MKNYSQNNEQGFILAACPTTGRMLEIGAWHPTDKSNTRALFESGWSGVLVEPSPKPFAGLLAEYEHEPRIKLVNAAVVVGDATHVGMYVTADAVSTTENAVYDKWKGHAKYDGQIVVPAITLERLYAEHGEFDFVSIDAEGTSGYLMHHLFEMGKRPNCLCVEYDNRLPELLSAATQLGYAAVYVSGENVVLVR